MARTITRAMLFSFLVKRKQDWRCKIFRNFNHLHFKWCMLVFGYFLWSSMFKVGRKLDEKVDDLEW